MAPMEAARGAAFKAAAEPDGPARRLTWVGGGGGAAMAGSMPTAPAAGAPRREDAAAEDASFPWVVYGIEAGLLGAFVVAVFFLIVDLLAGRALWTPQVLGSALFLGQLPADGSPVQPVVVIGYTAIHVAVFVAFGVPAAFRLLAGQSSHTPGGTAVLAAVLFAGFELVFLSLAQLFVPGLYGVLGAGRVALANALAAGAMAVFLAVRASRRVPVP
jgi:hypothetical protein